MPRGIAQLWRCRPSSPADVDNPALSRVLGGQNAPILLRCPARIPLGAAGMTSGQPPRRLFQRVLEPLRGRGLVWADGAASAGSPSPSSLRKRPRDPA